MKIYVHTHMHTGTHHTVCTSAMSSRTFTKLFSVSNISIMTCFFFSSYVADTAGGWGSEGDGRGGEGRGGEGRGTSSTRTLAAPTVW